MTDNHWVLLAGTMTGTAILLDPDGAVVVMSQTAAPEAVQRVEAHNGAPTPADESLVRVQHRLVSEASAVISYLDTMSPGSVEWVDVDNTGARPIKELTPDHRACAMILAGLKPTSFD